MLPLPRATIVRLTGREVLVRWDDLGPIVSLNRDGTVTERHTFPLDSVELDTADDFSAQNEAAYEAAKAELTTRVGDAAKKRRLSQKTIDALLESIR